MFGTTLSPGVPAYDALERLLTLTGSILGTCAIALPEKRSPDALTFSHARAAERTHQVASWLLRGSDLEVLMRRTPFLCQTRDELWEYYKSFPLECRLDNLCYVIVTTELLSYSGVLSREQFPRTRRVLDVYAAAVGVAGAIPQKLFFTLHSWFWVYEHHKALREAGPQMPLPLSTEAGEALVQAFESAKQRSSELLATGNSACVKPGGSDKNTWATVLLLISFGAGTAAWFIGASRLRQLCDAAMTKGCTLIEQLRLACGLPHHPSSQV